MINLSINITTNSISNVSKNYEVILKITDFAIISAVSRNTITSRAVYSILTNSSVLTRVWVTVIFIYNYIIDRLRMFTSYLVDMNNIIKDMLRQ